MAGVLLILVGPAGAGKTTLARRLIDARPDQRGFSVSHTTRPIRSGETHGKDYFFVARDAFLDLRERGGFAESACVHDNYYGTSKAEIAKLTTVGRDIIFDIDIEGALNLWRQYPDSARLVFILPPSWTALVQRLRDRGSETEETLRRRLRTARRELVAVLDSSAPWHVVRNDDIAAATAQLEALLDGSHQLESADSKAALHSLMRGANSDPLASD
ncbi:MAG: guanylate kinase [Myxococcales bacterium]|nr:guanylate kinase [Myxococcales bacterium]